MAARVIGGLLVNATVCPRPAERGEGKIAAPPSNYDAAVGGERSPKQLLAYFSGDFTEDDVIAVRELALTLAAIGVWMVASPIFVNTTDDSSCTRPEDEPIRTVGIALPLANGDGSTAPVQDLTALVDALAEFSRERNVDFEMELDGTFVGAIEHGVPDQLIQVGPAGDLGTHMTDAIDGPVLFQ